METLLVKNCEPILNSCITHLKICNFRSIKNCTLSDLRRINLFIGKPNTGKSNIIEALSLFSLPYLKENAAKKLTNLIRVEDGAELFNNGNTGGEILVKTNLGECRLSYDVQTGLLVHLAFPNHNYKFNINKKFEIKGGRKNGLFESPVKQYSYNENVIYKKAHSRYLIPPYGYNIFGIIEEYPDIKKQVIELFKQFNLQIAFDRGSQTIKVIQSRHNNNIFLLPYNSVASTIQRSIFYLSAILSNEKSILLFENPEAHVFPSYLTRFTHEMIHKTDNQYFVATHSPFILNDLLENARNELAVFVVYYEECQTKIKQLSDKELHEVYQSGVDFFTNGKSFV